MKYAILKEGLASGMLAVTATVILPLLLLIVIFLLLGLKCYQADFVRQYDIFLINKFTAIATLSPGAPFVMRWKSGPLARSNDILVLNGFLNTID